MGRHVVYQYWTGGDMPPARRACFDSTRGVFGVPVELVTDKIFRDYVVPGHPLHPCFDLLSVNHKSDYVRCYLLRFHGGGWADIKQFSDDNNWAESFDVLDRTPDADVLGEWERPRGMAFRTYKNDDCARRSIVTSYLIGKPDTPFTRMWYSRMVRWLDMMRAVVESRPSTGTYGSPGYPLPYFSVMGEPFHYTCVKMSTIRPGAVLRSLRSGRVHEVPYR